MIVHELNLRGFTIHKNTSLTFPEKGVVLVTGKNGSGKSSLAEGVAFAAFGETLRGTAPGGREENACTAYLKATGGREVTVTRQRKRDKVSLTLDAGAVEYPTTSKAQTALEGVLGTFEAWRRTHVFSSADAAHFTMATDKERKLFLENWTGLGRFDPALATCRKELTAALSRLDASRGRLQMVQAELASIQRRAEDARRTLDTLPEKGPPGGHDATLATLRHSIKATEASMRHLREEAADVTNAQGAHWADVKALQARLGRLAKPGEKCGECGQPLPVDVEARRALEEAVGVTKRAAEEAGAAKEREMLGLKEQLADDERTLARLREKETAISRAAGAKEATERTKRTAELALASADEALEVAKAAEEAVQKEVPALAMEVKVLEAAEAALGLRGVRAGIFTRLLVGLEAAANAWLPRLCGTGLRLELKPYSEKKSGGVSDAISIQVHGAGGGEGYRAASQGERRRLDIALLLAFSGKGSLFLDECLDSLDAEGIDAVCGVLEDLAKDRAVVLITHNPDLAQKVPHVAHWRVKDGAIGD